MSNIEYLYRYTSLESLALILKSRQIRLNPLDKMDDLQEQKTADVENLGKFVFISSWTEESDESIPMWRMYTDPRAGVHLCGMEQRVQILLKKPACKQQI